MLCLHFALLWKLILFSVIVRHSYKIRYNISSKRFLVEAASKLFCGKDIPVVAHVFLSQLSVLFWLTVMKVNCIHVFQPYVVMYESRDYLAFNCVCYRLVWRVRWLRWSHCVVIHSRWWLSSAALDDRSLSTGLTTTATGSNTASLTMHSSSTFGRMKLTRGYSETTRRETSWLQPTVWKCICRKSGLAELLIMSL